MIQCQGITNSGFITTETGGFLTAYNNENDTNIFEYAPDENVVALKEELSGIADNNGVFLEGWDEIKAITGIGSSESKCEDAIEKYKKGEISYEEALEEIEGYKQKQDNSLNLFANIAVSVLSIAAATAATVVTGGAASPLLTAAVGAGVGAVAKAGFKTIDRATNEIEDDALQGKQIAKDMLSGAVTGAIAAKTMGNGSAVANHDLKKAVLTNAPKCAVTGLKAGAISGASNYLIDCGFEDDEDFNFKDLANVTAANAAVGSLVGGIMGSFNGVMKTTGIISHGGQAAMVEGSLANTGLRDIAANSVCSAEYKLLTRGINDIIS